MFRPQTNIVRLGMVNLFKQEIKYQKIYTRTSCEISHICFCYCIDSSINDVFVSSFTNFAVAFL